MGIPRFYRWLSEKYPLINTKIDPTLGPFISGAVETTSDASSISQLGDNRRGARGTIESSLLSTFGVSNAIDADCLYLDLNGVIHNATHANSGGLVLQESFSEVWLNIFAYITCVVATVRPSRLLFIAVDGVAPRAKMNQQRIRRFRAAKDRDYQSEMKEQMTRTSVTAFQQMSSSKDPLIESMESDFDSNCITPGTEFMAELTTQLKFLIAKQMSEDPLWMNIEVVFSGPDVPGEGEHKIMEFIRAMRTHSSSGSSYPESLCHCIHGLDADLIMLSLMTHEPRFWLFREIVQLGKIPSGYEEEFRLVSPSTPFQLLSVTLVREYLFLDAANRMSLNMYGGTSETEEDPPPTTSTSIVNDAEFLDHYGFTFDMERLIDDFVLVACFSGNDFLPHMSFGDISKGGLDELFDIYVYHLQIWEPDHQCTVKDGTLKQNRTPWLIENQGTLVWKNVQSFLSYCAESEATELEKVREDLHYLLAHEEQRPTQHQKQKPNRMASGLSEPCGSDDLPLLSSPEDLAVFPPSGSVVDEPDVSDIGKYLQDGGNLQTTQGVGGFYYYRKLKINVFTAQGQRELENLVRSYLEGLQWTMYYYYRGTPSWSWFYPYHYPPLVTDVADFLLKYPDWVPRFELSTPLDPYEQLMAVLPPKSARLVPEIFRPLMSHPKSPLIQYYPTDFDIDMEGVTVSWGGVTLLPFIDCMSLRNEMANVIRAGTFPNGPPPYNWPSAKSQVEFMKRQRVGCTYIYTNNPKWSNKSPLPCNSRSGALQDYAKHFVCETLSKFPETLMSYERENRRLNPKGLLRYFKLTKPAQFTVFRMQYPDLQFAHIQMGPHVSELNQGYQSPLYLPSLLDLRTPLKTLQDPKRSAWTLNELQDTLSGKVILKMTPKQVRVFWGVTRFSSLCIWPLATNCLSNLITAIKKSVTLLDCNSITDTLDKFACLPNVLVSYPYKRMAKVIGVYSSFGGYWPLHVYSSQVSCSFYSSIDFNTAPEGELVDWKQSMPTKLYCAVSAIKYLQMLRSGLGFSESSLYDETMSSPNCTVDAKGFIRHLQTQLNQLKTHCSNLSSKSSGRLQFSKNVDLDELAKTLTSKDILLEVLPIVGVSTLPNGSLKIQWGTLSELYFLPLVKFVDTDTPWVKDPNVPRGLTFKPSEEVLCIDALSTVCGSIGMVVQQQENTTFCRFTLKESLEMRYNVQRRICEIITSNMKSFSFMKIEQMAKTVAIPSHLLNWLIKRVVVRVKGDALASKNVGLSVVGRALNAVTGEKEMVTVPGFAQMRQQGGGGSRVDILLSAQLIPIIQQITTLMPNLLPAMQRALEADKHFVNLEDVFYDSVNDDLTRTDRLWRLERVHQWLQRQPIRTGRMCGSSSQSLSDQTLRDLQGMFHKKSLDDLRCPYQVGQTVLTSTELCLPANVASPQCSDDQFQHAIVLGQRVVYIKRHGQLPVGSKGVVVGVHPCSLVDMTQIEDPDVLGSTVWAEVILEQPVINSSMQPIRHNIVTRLLHIACVPAIHLLPLPPYIHWPHDTLVVPTLKFTRFAEIITQYSSNKHFSETPRIASRGSSSTNAARPSKVFYFNGHTLQDTPPVDHGTGNGRSESFKIKASPTISSPSNNFTSSASSVQGAPSSSGGAQSATPFLFVDGSGSSSSAVSARGVSIWKNPNR